MLNSREMTRHAALCSERCSCLTLLAAFVGTAIGFSAIGLLFVDLRVPCFLAVGLDLIGTAALGDRLRRINRRLRELEEFL
jgi:hypothetical protein